MSGRAADTLAPSDVVRSRQPRGKRLQIGGRVVLHDGATLVLADAFATLRLSLKPPPKQRFEAGDLLVVAARRDRAGALQGRVVRRFPGAPPRALGFPFISRASAAHPNGAPIALAATERDESDRTRAAQSRTPAAPDAGKREATEEGKWLN